MQRDDCCSFDCREMVDAARRTSEHRERREGAWLERGWFHFVSLHSCDYFESNMVVPVYQRDTLEDSLLANVVQIVLVVVPSGNHDSAL